VVGDLAGFVAAIYLRGIPCVQIPTTIVAQVDSSVGGKTGVNARAGKNLIGAFHQPRLVLADTLTLETLPDREYREGFAEVIKHAVIRDAAMLDDLDPAAPRESLAPLIARNIAIKAAIVLCSISATPSDTPSRMSPATASSSTAKPSASAWLPPWRSRKANTDSPPRTPAGSAQNCKPTACP
jgi:hypothetical protein